MAVAGVAGGGDVTAAATAAWDLPTHGVLTLDYVSHTTRVTHDAQTILPAAFEELILRLARATRLDAAGAAAAAVAAAPSPGAPAEGGVMGVEGYVAQQVAAIAEVAAAAGAVVGTDVVDVDVDDGNAHAPAAENGPVGPVGPVGPYGCRGSVWVAEETEDIGSGRELTPEVGTRETQLAKPYNA